MADDQQNERGQPNLHTVPKLSKKKKHKREHTLGSNASMASFRRTNTCGKPLANKPKPTTQTTGTKTTGLKNLQYGSVLSFLLSIPTIGRERKMEEEETQTTKRTDDHFLEKIGFVHLVRLPHALPYPVIIFRNDDTISDP